MKKTLSLFSLALILSLQAYAQNSAVTNAILYQRDGELAKAKQNIDQAAEHEKTRLLSKTWYYKGLVYSDIYKSDKVELKESTPKALTISTESLLKSKELDKNPNGEYSKLSHQLLEENWAAHINSAVAYHQSKQYKEALEMYELAQRIKPSDTTAYVYAAYAAEANDDRELQVKNAYKLLSLNNKSLYTYSVVISDELENKRYPEASSLLDKALKDFPLHKNLLHFRTQAQLESGKIDEGIAVLNQELKDNPYNVDILTNLSILYSQKKDNDQVLLTYNKIIAIEPYHFVANFNSAVLTFDKGKELAKKNDKKGSEAMFQKSLEYAKKAKSLASEDNDVDNLQRLINELNLMLGK